MRRMSVITAPPIEFGLSIKALPLQGLNPAGKEDQLSRADCREGLLIFEAANWLETERGGARTHETKRNNTKQRSTSSSKFLGG